MLTNVARYEFSTEKLYVVKVTSSRKTLKCYDFKKKQYTWRKEITDSLFDQRDIVLYFDLLLILCNSTIVRFLKDTGNNVADPIRSTYMPGDALSMRLIEKADTVVVTAKSNDPQKSSTLYCVGL